MSAPVAHYLVLGDLLRSAREIHHEARATAAYRVGVGKSTLAGWEAGTSLPQRRDVLVEYLRTLGTPPSAVQLLLLEYERARNARHKRLRIKRCAEAYPVGITYARMSLRHMTRTPGVWDWGSPAGAATLALALDDGGYLCSATGAPPTPTGDRIASRRAERSVWRVPASLLEQAARALRLGSTPDATVAALTSASAYSVVRPREWVLRIAMVHHLATQLAYGRLTLPGVEVDAVGAP